MGTMVAMTWRMDAVSLRHPSHVFGHPVRKPAKEHKTRFPPSDRHLCVALAKAQPILNSMARCQLGFCVPKLLGSNPLRPKVSPTKSGGYAKTDQSQHELLNAVFLVVLHMGIKHSSLEHVLASVPKDESTYLPELV